MKNHFYLIVSLFAVLFLSCQKEENLMLEDVNTEQTLVLPSKIKKEITITDKTGNNSVIMAIYADEEKFMDDFVNGNDFKLLINEHDTKQMKSTANAYGVSTNNYDSGDFNLKEQPKIHIEFVTENLEKNVRAYSVDIQKNKTKSFIVGYPISKESTRSFLGVVHKGWGYEFLTKLYFKKYFYSIGWKSINDGVVNAWLLDGVQNHIHVNPGFDVHKKLIVLYPHSYQNGKNYQFFEENWRYNNFINGSGDGDGSGADGPTPDGTPDIV